MLLIEVLKVVEDVGILSFLAYAAYSDYKTRIIEDKVWAFMLLTLAPITLYLLFSAYVYLIPLYIVSLSLGVGIGIFMGLTKLTGGADVKAIMVLSAIIIPKGLSPTLIPSLTVILNSVVFSLITIAYVVIKNIITHIKLTKLFDEEMPFTTKVVLLLTAHKEKVNTVLSQPYRYFVIESREKGKKYYRLALFKANEETIEIVKKLLSQGVKENDYIWVSPSIPLIVYILIGYTYYVLCGNVLEPLLTYSLRII